MRPRGAERLIIARAARRARSFTRGELDVGADLRGGPRRAEQPKLIERAAERIAAALRIVPFERDRGDDAALTGVTLGGAAIADDATWSGSATPQPLAGGQLVLAVRAASAIVVTLHP